MVSRDIGISEHVLAIGVRGPRMLFEVSWVWRACTLRREMDSRASAEGAVFVSVEHRFSEVFFREPYHSGVHEPCRRWARCAQHRSERLDCRKLLLPTLAACSCPTILEDIQPSTSRRTRLQHLRTAIPPDVTAGQWQRVSFGEALTFTKFPRTLSRSKTAPCVSSSHSFGIFIPGKMFAFAIFN